MGKFVLGAHNRRELIARVEFADRAVISHAESKTWDLAVAHVETKIGNLIVWSGVECLLEKKRSIPRLVGGAAVEKP